MRKVLVAIIFSLAFLHVSAQKSKSEADKYAETGNTKYESNDYEGAISDFTKAIELKPSALNYLMRAAARAMSKDYKGAIEDCSRCLELDPKKDYALYIRGSMKSELNDIEGAVADLNKLLETNPGSADYSGFKASLEMKQKEFTNALETLGKAITSHPDSGGLYALRASVYYRMNGFEEAVTDTKKAISLRPYSYMYMNMCEFLSRLHRFAEAAEYYKKSIREGYNYLSDAGPSWRFFIKYVEAVTDAISQGDYNIALSMLKESVDLYNEQSEKEDDNKNTSLVSVYAAIGFVLEKLNRDEEAADIYKKALVISSDQKDIIDALAAVEKKLSDIAKRDHEPPVIEIITPKPTRSFEIGSDNGKIEIIGKAKDNSGIDWVKINGSLVEKVEEDGIFIMEMSLKAGPNEIIVVAKDKQGNESNKTFTLTGNAVAAGKVKEPSLALMADAPQNYYAILIANSNYNDPSIPDLKNPLNDARELRKTLQSLYTFNSKNIDTVFNRNREDVLQSIMARCSKLGENDNLLIFYAGHGTAEKDKFGDIDGFWIPVSAKKGFTGSYISSNDINFSLRKSNAKHILLIADACFSGAFTRALPAEAGVNIQKQYSVPSRKIMASGNLEPVPDNSKFIFYLRKSLQENKEKYISAKDLFDSFYKSILSNTDNLPQYAAIKNVGDEGGEFVFIKK
jgi:tetratricopeptide (TPR) repeat protein